MVFGYLESEKIISKARLDLTLGFFNLNISDVDNILKEADVYDTILIAVEEYMNIHQIELNTFLKNFSFERWTDWCQMDDTLEPVTNYDSYVQAIHYLKQCPDIKTFFVVNGLDFLFDSDTNDFYFYVEEL